MSDYNIKVTHSGKYPNLCAGETLVVIYGQEYEVRIFTTGTCLWDGENEIIEEGPWRVTFPEGFPEHLKQCTEDAINEQIPWGCCGGCM